MLNYDYDYEPITLLDVGILASEFNDNVLQMLDTNTDFKTRFDNAANEQEVAAISKVLKGVKIARDYGGEVIALRANNMTEEELAGVFENCEDNIEELINTTTFKQFDAANAYASIIERLNLGDQFQSVVPALMATKKQVFISLLDAVSEEPEALPVSPQPGLRAFLRNLSL